MMEDAMDVAKNKNKANKDRKKQERFVKQQDMGRQLKRAQRYLGLRSKNEIDGRSSTCYMGAIAD